MSGYEKLVHNIQAFNNASVRSLGFSKIYIFERIFYTELAKRICTSIYDLFISNLQIKVINFIIELLNY